MAQGETFHTPITRFNDERTGRAVWQITCWADCHCIGTYMYHQAFACDERYVVFASDRSGKWEIYRIDLQTETTVQLTEEPADHPRWHHKLVTHYQVHPNDREVLFGDAGGIHAIDVETLEQRQLLRLDSNGWKKTYTAGASLTRDAKQQLIDFEAHDGTRGIALAPLDGGPVRELFRLHDPTLGLGHTLVAPGDDLLISFGINPDKQRDMEAEHDRRARCWAYRASDGQVFNLLTLPKGFHATHETWGSDRRLYFHRKTYRTWVPTWIASVADDGSDYREHFRSDHRKLGHSCVSPDTKWIVSDVQDPEGNELYLIDRETGASEILCWPDARTADGLTGHVHPQFSPSGTKILYTSDRTGKAAVFVVPLPMGGRRSAGAVETAF